MHVDHVADKEGDAERDQDAENGRKTRHGARIAAVAHAPVNPHEERDDRDLNGVPDITLHGRSVHR